jgi:hypothetical protein
VELGLIRNFNNPVKVLGQGDLKISLNVTADKFSASAIKKIESAGGTVTVIDKKKWVRAKTTKPKVKKQEVEKVAEEPEATESTEETESSQSE